MALKKLECEGVDWTELSQDMALVNRVMNCQFPLKVENFLTS